MQPHAKGTQKELIHIKYRVLAHGSSVAVCFAVVVIIVSVVLYTNNVLSIKGAMVLGIGGIVSGLILGSIAGMSYHFARNWYNH
jgi:hypothetical protein